MNLKASLPAEINLQAGCVALTAGTTDYAVTFPKAFYAKPVTTGTVTKALATDDNVFPTIYGETAAGFSFTTDGSPVAGQTLNWQAIGQ